MPYTGPGDDKLPDNVKKLAEPKRAQWVNVFNSAFDKCAGQENAGDDCEAVAFRMANGVVFEEMALFTPPRQAGISGLLSVVELRTLAQRDNGASKWAQGILDKLNEAAMSSNLTEVTKTIDGKPRPAGDFLVVDDSEMPSTWHLPVKVNGKPDHRLMGAAWAALHQGSRGNKYEGPGKAQAIRDLTALYKSEDMETPPIAEMADMAAMYAPMGAMSFADLRAAEQASEAADYLHKLAYQFEQLVRNIVLSETNDKMARLKALANEFLALAAETLGEEMGTDAQMESSDLYASGAAVEFLRDATPTDLSEAGVSATENGRRAPVVVDFMILEPGPGNKRDNHFYLKETVRRDVHVFEGVDVFATDHRESERNERTKVGKVLKCPTGFTESGGAIAPILIYDPYFAEKARNRSDANELGTLECSIFGNGRARPGEIDGKKYRIVEALTQGVYVELVSKAGAGGHALRLAESEVNDMTEQEQQAELEEVQIEEEAQAGGESQDTPQPPQEVTETDPEPLNEAAVGALIPAHLPDETRKRILARTFLSEDDAKQAITIEVDYLRAVTGSGKPFGKQQAQAPAVVNLSEAASKNKETHQAIRSRWFGS